MSTSFSDYLNQEIHCSCGRTHICDIDDIIIEAGALTAVPALIQKGGYTNVCLVEDTNTKAAAGEALKDILANAGIAASVVTLRAEGLLPDEYGIGSLLTHVPADCGLLLAVGSGTINDLCRFVSYKKNIEYFIIGTAPSMDGFTSNVAAMITDHTKTTYEAHKPKAVIGDLDILSKAPMDLIAAGVGDVIGKYVCLTDWKMAHLITGEYFCEEVEALVRKSIQKVSDAAMKIGSRDKAAIAGLMEGLVLSGIAMSYIGNSRPASGSEHHLSHYWEMMFLQHGEHGAWHGTKVGVGTVTALRLYQLFAEAELDFSALSAYTFDETAWEKAIACAYGTAAPSVLSLEKEVKKNSTPEVQNRLQALQTHLSEIKQLAKALPAPETIRDMLEQLGAPYEPKQLGVDRQLFVNSILYAKDLRNRYGLLQVLYDTGLNQKFAELIADELYK
ncbi:MAG: sn-glycerol-1-phosphate dehydrogenase [Lachnospiraceae bacterium]|nr:sn-glycerol-1-phosphate dehydrogenase [Lachnospiraceae bacterium]